MDEEGQDGGALSLQVISILMNMYDQMMLGYHQSYSASRDRADTNDQSFWGKKLVTVATFAGTCTCFVFLLLSVLFTLFFFSNIGIGAFQKGIFPPFVRKWVGYLQKAGDLEHPFLVGLGKFGIPQVRNSCYIFAQF